MILKAIAMLSLVIAMQLNAKILPTKSINIASGINDIAYQDGKLYVATTQGRAKIIDIASNKLLKEIRLHKIKDFMGDAIDPEIFSIDVAQDRILLLSQDNNGYTRLDLYRHGKHTPLLDAKDRLYIVKAKFVAKESILLGLLSNVYMLYDIGTKKVVWQKQINLSKFSNFALNDTKEMVATADESGDVSIVLLKDGSIKHHFSGLNKDEVFGIDWKKDTIITGGKDKKIALYDTKMLRSSQKSYGFFIYSVALSSDAKMAAASIDEKNSVSIFDPKSKEEIARLVGNNSKVVAIRFIDNNQRLIIATNRDKINIFDIPK